ncbi:hypothetical protein [Paramicrobacterium agarici]|uniref:hypothetical protein n=1 Tax=Paramicrobacterium agarici TaxID=630514 RepID=UPI001151505E|nr:hypothetical protein [Microbacterium agarici]TQO22544.1 hypothetical protein FB385_1375 [Microbacterium agarici]
MSSLWWVPSLVVFGTTALIIVGVVLAVKARRRRAIASGRIADTRPEPIEHLEVRAGQALVQADEAVRRGVEEHAFAAAQFGVDETAAFAAAIESARGRLSEAFELRQRLSDVTPDTDADRRAWSESILQACTNIESTLDEHTDAFVGRRSEERLAPERVASLRALRTQVEARIPDAVATLARLSKLYAPAAFADQRDAVTTATAQLAEADTALSRAESAVAATEPAVPALEKAEGACRDATTALDALARAEERLADADTELREAIVEAERALAEASELRDSSEIPDAAERIASGITELRRVLDTVSASTGPQTPLRSVDDIRFAQARLDDALASARSAQQRIDSARETLSGALFSATSHLDTAREFIAANRGRVGPDARTRLAEAERQLALAKAAGDPVEAVDIARRAARLAQDAGDLAHYDAGPRTAPIKRHS